MNISGNYGFCSSPYIYHLNADGQVIGRRNTRTNEYEEGNDFPSEYSEDSMKYVSAEEFSKIIEKAKAEYEITKAETERRFANAEIVDFYKMNWIGETTLTGCKDMDESMMAGIRFREKCFTFSGTDEEFNRTFVDLMLKKDAPDYTGMSKTEIFKAEYEKFQSIWGEDFLDAEALNCFVRPEGGDRYLNVINLFKGRVSGLCGEKFENIYREALYPDMTEGEMQLSIIEKYKEKKNGILQNSDLCKIANEMRICGVDNGLYAFMNHYGIESDVSFMPGLENLIIPTEESWLDKKVTKTGLDRLHDIYGGIIAHCNVPMNPRLGFMIELLRTEAMPNVNIHL